MYRDKLCCYLFVALFGCIGVHSRQNLARRHQYSPADSVVQALNVTGSGRRGKHNSSVPVRADISQFECKELRSKRYISDGFCTSYKPVTEVVCAGNCLPLERLPWYAEYMKVYSQKKVAEFRCVEESVRRKRVKLLCDNGSTRTYRIKVVRACKCKRYQRRHNETNGALPARMARRSRRRRRRKQRVRGNKTFRKA